MHDCLKFWFWFSSCPQNPSKPHFNHYLFESLCLSIRITCKANPSTVGSFEEALFPVFTEILQNDVQGGSSALASLCLVSVPR